MWDLRHPHRPPVYCHRHLGDVWASMARQAVAILSYSPTKEEIRQTTQRRFHHFHHGRDSFVCFAFPLPLTGVWCAIVCFLLFFVPVATVRRNGDWVRLTSYRAVGRAEVGTERWLTSTKVNLMKTSCGWPSETVVIRITKVSFIHFDIKWEFWLMKLSWFDY